MSTHVAPRSQAINPPEAPQPFVPPWMRMIAVVLLGQVAIQGFKNFATNGSVWPQPNAQSLEGFGDIPNVNSVSNTPAQALAERTPADDQLPPNAVPLWPLGTALSLYVFLSSAPDAQNSTTSYTSEPILAWNDVQYGDWKDKRASDLTVDLSLPEHQAVLRENGTLWADIVTVSNGKLLQYKEVNEALRDPKQASVTRKVLTRFYPRRRIIKVKNLLQSKEEEEAEDLEEAEAASQDQPIVAHWSQNLTIGLLSDGATMPYGRQQGPIRDHIKLDREHSRDEVGNGFYYPIVFVNDFWLLREDQYPINTTITTLPLHINLEPLGALKFNLYASMQAASEAPKQSGVGAGMGDLDDLKRMLITANPYGLMLTAVVTVLHMIFEFLAFSSDVKHWRKKDKDLVGVSLRSIITNVVIQLVIMLYLYDSSEETSMMILATQAFGLVIEVWKISKVVDVKFSPTVSGAPLTMGSLYGMSPYVVTFEDKKQLSEDELKSQEYDRTAFRIVGYAAVPILAIYALYTLKYHSYKSWYSYGISTLAQAIYMFGFAQLVPQLIINYKLKSVAHIPLKAMIYKTLGTFVDDIFSFSIKMPTLHRIACLRDDVIYFIMLYQMWIYRIDYSRANEFGQVSTDAATESEKGPCSDDLNAEGLRLAERLLATHLSRDWRYLAEGGANIVYAYIGSEVTLQHRVLRSRKLSPGYATTNVSCDSVHAAPNAYFRERMLPSIIPQAYLAKSERAVMPWTWIEELQASHDSARPEKRRREDVLSGNPFTKSDSERKSTCEVLVMENLLGGTDCLAVEVKPKAGFLPSLASLPIDASSAVKATHCRFCLHRNLRNYTASNSMGPDPAADVLSAPHYCPLDLFSGDEERVRHAVDGLVKGWQTSRGDGNNLRIFLNGEPAREGTFSEAADETSGITKPSIERISDDLTLALTSSTVLRDLLRAQRGLMGDEDIERLWADLIAWSETAEGETSRSVDHMLRDPTAEELADLAAYLGLTPGSTPLLPPSAKGSEGIVLRYRLLAFAMCATFKDCSVIVRYPLHQDARSIIAEKGLPARGTQGSSGPAFSDPIIKLVDLDLKPMAKFPKWLELDREIVKAFTELPVGERRPCRS